MPLPHDHPRNLPRILVLFLVLLTPLPGAAQEQPGGELRILVKDAAPFTMQDETGHWIGISMELWNRIATALGRPWSLEVAPDLESMLSSVREGRCDLAVGALTITAGREAEMDFSRSFFESGLGIATTGGEEEGLLSFVARLFSIEFLQVILGLIAMLFVAGLLVWLFERRRNREQFGGSAGRGLGEGLWWAAVTMTTVGYGDRAPQTSGGRAVALIWMFASILLISSFTAAIASSLTISRLEGAVNGPDDLRHVEVGVIEDSTGAGWARQKGLRVTRFPDVGSALEALQRGTLGAVVHDSPILRYAIAHRQGSQLRVLPYRLDRQMYAFAFPTGSPLQEDVNRELLRVTGSSEWDEILARFLGP